VSRSGSTLTAALFLGFKREEAARFSFLLGLPAIAAAGLKELYILYFKTNLDAYGWSVLGVGILVGTISAFLAIWSLMRVLENFSSWPFVFYRAFFGGALLVGVYLGIFQ
jgi:undecaprenyl-diphosphatase